MYLSLLSNKVFLRVDIYRLHPRRNFRFLITEKENMYHMFLKTVVIGKRLLTTGWIEIFCLRKKYRSNAWKKGIIL